MKVVNYNKLLSKLDKPPSGPNWVRFIHYSDIVKTTKSIISFVKGMPRFNYASGYTAIKDRIHLGIDFDTALKIVQQHGSLVGRKTNEELIKAFYTHDERRQYPKHAFIEFDREWFLISRDIKVPVVPLSIIRENGHFVPLFVCGWSEIKLTDFQRRLLVSIYEDSFLSLTDYLVSPAEYLFFPKNDNDVEKQREVEVWQRGDYISLSNQEMNEALDIFLQAREAARKILLQEMAEEFERHKNEVENTTILPPMRDLFNFNK